MEILQISDLHLRGDGKLSFRKVDTPACLRTAAAYLHALNRMPDAIVITGDLADSGDEHAYHMLYEALGDLPVPIYAVPGNHDPVSYTHLDVYKRQRILRTICRE